MIAAFCRGSLETIDAYDRDLATRVRAALDPMSLTRIETASRLAWLPIDLDVELTRAVFSVAGMGRAQEIFRHGMIASLDAPLLRPIRVAAGALFAGSIRDVLGWTPRVWSTIYRDCGAVALVERGPGSVDLNISGLPRSILAYPNYLLGTAATVEAVFDAFGVQGRIDLIGPNLNESSAILRARWVTG